MYYVLLFVEHWYHIQNTCVYLSVSRGGRIVMLRAGVGLAAVAGTLVRSRRARVRHGAFFFYTARALDHACVPMVFEGEFDWV